MTTYALYQDLSRCVNCFTCMVGCKTYHELPEGKQRIVNRAFGPFRINGKLRIISFNLLDYSDECSFKDCIPRYLETGERPSCVNNCPTQSMKFGTVEDLSKDAAKEGGQIMVLRTVAMDK